jgi:hypothetical protein
MSLEEYRKSKSLDKLLGAIKEADEPQVQKKSYVDERMWKPELDKTGNGYAVIRFLPAAQIEKSWVKLYSHAFQGPTGQWFIENSLTTLPGGKDPVSEHNTALWNSGVESDKELARKQKRKLSYYSNIYVVSDPKHPENEGKVFLFRYGKKIWDKISEAATPAFEDEKPLNAFDLDEGADFKLKIRKVDGYWNYDKSEFAEPSKLAEDDKLEEIFSSQYDLQEFLAPSNFKSYDELKTRLDIVLSGMVVTKTAEAIMDEPVAPVVDTTPVSAPDTTNEEDDDTMSYFEKLAGN